MGWLLGLGHYEDRRSLCLSPLLGYSRSYAVNCLPICLNENVAVVLEQVEEQNEYHQEYLPKA